MDLKAITAMDKEATRFVKGIISPRDHLKIEFDVEKRDRYGRLLAEAYLPVGKMLNEEILKAGYANFLTYPPNVKYRDRLLKAYRELTENRKGLWRQGD